jgi:flagellar biosynthetic protein FlhB
LAEDLGEKTELPTSRRLSEARERGQVAKSQDLAAAIDLIGGVALVALFGGSLLHAGAGVMRHVLERPHESLNADAVGGLVMTLSLDAAWRVAPILALLVAVGFAAQFMQFGLVLTTYPLQPKLSRLSPIAGIKRIFDRRNLVKTAVNCVKLAAVIAIAVLYLQTVLGRVSALPLLTAGEVMAVLGRIALELAAWLLAVLLCIGAIDFLFQRWQHTQDLKMTKDQVKDERRSMEGDPAVKSRRYKLMRELALQRINQLVPRADVIVTNPTHFSVAIQYDSATMRAPRVVAKGADYLAHRIRQVAMVHRVPIIERPPLARALFYGVDAGQEVSPEFYEAVAELLAYVYRLESQAA